MDKLTIVFLDDERYIDDVFWIKYPDHYNVITVRNLEQFKNIDHDINNILYSFDHDLQDFNNDGSENTGMTCVKWLCNKLLDEDSKSKINFIVHSKNPVGKENIESYIEYFNKIMGP